MMETTKITTPLTIDNLPKGPLWDEDGACFEAVLCDGNTGPIVEWFWSCRNLKAMAKGKPDKEMYDFVSPSPQNTA